MARLGYRAWSGSARRSPTAASPSSAFRGRYSEVKVWLFSSILFGLLHGANVVLGQGAGPTVRQIIFAFFIGGVFYAIRPVAIVVPMVIHALWDFGSFTHVAGKATGVATGNVDLAAAGMAMVQNLLMLVAIILIIVGARRVLRDQEARRAARAGVDLTAADASVGVCRRFARLPRISVSARRLLGGADGLTRAGCVSRRPAGRTLWLRLRAPCAILGAVSTETPSPERGDFIREIVAADLREGRHQTDRHPLPAGAERLPPHRPRQVDLPQLRHRAASSAAAATCASTTRTR